MSRACGGAITPLSLFLLAACTASGAGVHDAGGVSPAPPPPGAEQLPDRAEFVANGLALTAQSREELRSALGEPDSVEMEIVPNRHVPGVRDTLFTLYHDDVIARIHHPGGGGDLLSMLEVASNRHLRYPVVGLATGAVRQAFGAPDEERDGVWVYRCTTCTAGDDPAELLVEGDVVRRVRFHFYVD